jgi:peptidoglycan/xylan/chitin deacetylase (PgdA/CDA1 family)
VYTPQVLQVLERNDARGTFFVTGANISGHERLLWRMVLGGSEIGNGTWTQSPGVAESAARLRAELRRTSAAVVAAARVRPCFARPPYRRDVARNVAVSGRLGMSTALWSVDPRDYASNRPAEIAARALAGARPGAVIVLHDGGSNRWATVQALEPILRGLARRGYRTVTMSELERNR